VRLGRRLDTAGATASGTAVTRPPAYVRFVCLCHALLASAFLACVVVQAFFAGVGIFGANWSFRTYFVALIAVLAPVARLLGYRGSYPKLP
jgi:hypothetical protein